MDLRRRTLCGVGGLAALGWVPARAEADWLDVHVSFSGSTSSRAFFEALTGLIGGPARIRWTLQYLPWARALMSAQRGECLVYGLSRNRQREAGFEFSDPVTDNRVWMLVRRQSETAAIDSLQGLQDQRVCLRRGTSYGDAFDAAKGSLFPVEYSDGSLSNRLQMLLSGHCDVLTLSSRHATAGALEAQLGRLGSLSEGARVLPRPLVVEPMHFAAARGSAQVAAIARINFGLRQQKAALQTLLQSAV